MPAPTQAPTADELIADPFVLAALAEAWIDSRPNDSTRRHEEGGWVYLDLATGVICTRRAPTGAKSGIELGGPPLVAGSVIVATFHTHPNPSSDGWNTGPSMMDEAGAAMSG